MDLNRHRRLTSVMPAALITAIALALGLYLASAQRGEAAVTPITGDDLAATPNAAICVSATDTDAFVEAELVDTTTCPDTGDEMLPYLTKWIELDFSGNTIWSEFAPDASELDGLTPGARIDLRETGVNQNEIDLSEAIKANADNPTSRELFCAISVNVGETTDDCGNAVANLNGRSPTFLLDGGDDETGLGNLPTSVDEGAILYIPFHFGDRPRGLSIPVETGACSGNPPNVSCSGSPPFDGSRGSGDSVERFVAIELTVTHKGLDIDRAVYVLASSRDPDDTLYVVPVLISGDRTIDDDEDAKVEVTGVQVGRNQGGDPGTAMANGGPLVPTGFDLQYLYDRGAVLDGYDDDFEDDLATATDSVRVEDVDSPRYPVCERHPQVIEAIESSPVIDDKCQRISLHALSTIETLGVYPGGEIDDPLEEIYYSDLEGLTGLTFLNLGGNELRSLPSNVFRDVGVNKRNEVALIDMRFNPGRRSGSDRFLASDLSSSVRSNLQHLQVVRLNSDFGDRKGFDRTAYNVYESDVLVFEVRNDDAAPVVEFSIAANASNPTIPAGNAEDLSDSNSDLPTLPASAGTQLVLPGTGTYIVAVQMPFTGDEDRDNETFSMRLLENNAIEHWAEVTIRDVTRARTRTISTSSQVYQAPRRPTTRPAPSDDPSFNYPAFVIDNHYEVAPGNPDLRHNIPDLSVNIDGQTVIAGFLSHYRNTGGRERWGYPTSEVLVLEDRALTQFYQRGVVDFHDVGAGWLVERRLAWDYVGGGEGGSIDQGFESGPFNPNPGTLLGPWGNRVSNISIEGTNVGFADVFNRLGGVTAFGVPKTEARTDIVSSNRLLGPEQTPGFIRQYFQAAIFEFHPNVPSNPVQLALLGDTLRDLLVRDHARQDGFGAAGILIDGARYHPPVID